MARRHPLISLIVSFLLTLVFLVSGLFWFESLTMAQPASNPPLALSEEGFTDNNQHSVTTTLTATEVITQKSGSAAIWIHHTAENPLVHTVLVDGDFTWTGTNGDGVIRWNRIDGSPTRYDIKAGLVHNKVHAIAIGDDGTKWFGTEGGLSQLVLSDNTGNDEQVWTSYTTKDGLANNYVTAIAIDGNKELWVGTWGGGISRFDGENWDTFTRGTSELPDNFIHELVIDNEGELWAATPNGVGRFDGESWTNYTTADGLAHDAVISLAVDGDNNLWFGTVGGVSRFDGQRWATFTTEDGLVSNHSHGITVDQSGQLWVATAYGLSVFNGKMWISYSDNLPEQRFYAIDTDDENNIWLGAPKGILRFDGQNGQTYTTGNLPSNSVWRIAIDEAGHTWFETEVGISRFDGLFWTTPSTTPTVELDWQRSLTIIRPRVELAIFCS